MKLMDSLMTAAVGGAGAVAGEFAGSQLISQLGQMGVTRNVPPWAADLGTTVAMWYAGRLASRHVNQTFGNGMKVGAGVHLILQALDRVLPAGGPEDIYGFGSW